MSQWRLPGAADDRPTFFAHALALKAAHGCGPWPNGGYPLPREPVGLRTHYFEFRPAPSVAAQVAEAIRDIIAEPPEGQALQRLHEMLVVAGRQCVADELSRLVEGWDRERVRQVGRWLAEFGTNRGPVAIGLVLIGLTGDDRDRDMLLLLGCLEELAFEAAAALARTQSDRDMALFEYARRVRAWGRIHAVEQLEGTTDPEIKAWLLREGYRNHIQDYHLAHIAATTGDLAGALGESEVDDELLASAGGILAAMSYARPEAKDMTDYPDAAVAIGRYLTLVRDRPSLERIRVVLQLAEHDDRCKEILTDLDWLDMLDQAVNSPDYTTFGIAMWPAKQLGLRLHQQAVAWLQQYPHHDSLWEALDDTEESVRLAERLLTSAERSSDALCAVLKRFSHRSWPLVRTALSNTVWLSRGAAVQALRRWPRDSLPADAIDAVRAASAVESHDETRQAMLELLETWQRTCSSLTQCA